LVNVPYNTAIGNYAPAAGGHDAHSYWLEYKDPEDQTYTIVIAVPAGLPQHFAFALAATPKPHVDPSNHSKVIIVGASLTAQDRAYVSGGVAPETMSAFMQLAASKTVLHNVDTRMLTTKGMTVPVAASTNGSLATGLGYSLRWNPHLSASHGAPLPLIRELDCYQYDSSRGLVFFELPGVAKFSLSENGKTVISNSALAHDPIQPATAAYALFIPQSVGTVSLTTVPATKSFSFNLSDCESQD
jgi:hypothetical protein